MHWNCQDKIVFVLIPKDGLTLEKICRCAESIGNFKCEGDVVRLVWEIMLGWKNRYILEFEFEVIRIAVQSLSIG